MFIGEKKLRRDEEEVGTLNCVFEAFSHVDASRARVCSKNIWNLIVGLFLMN